MRKPSMFNYSHQLLTNQQDNETTNNNQQPITIPKTKEVICIMSRCLVLVNSLNVGRCGGDEN